MGDATQVVGGQGATGAGAGAGVEGEEYEYVCDVTDEKIDVAREGRYHYAM